MKRCFEVNFINYNLKLDEILIYVSYKFSVLFMNLWCFEMESLNNL